MSGGLTPLVRGVQRGSGVGRQVTARRCDARYTKNRNTLNEGGTGMTFKPLKFETPETLEERKAELARQAKRMCDGAGKTSITATGVPRTPEAERALYAAWMKGEET